MLSPTTENILVLSAVAVGIAALAVIIRSVVGTASGCMSILLRAVETCERVQALFGGAQSKQPGDNRQSAAVEKLQAADSPQAAEIVQSVVQPPEMLASCDSQQRAGSRADNSVQSAAVEKRQPEEHRQSAESMQSAVGTQANNNAQHAVVTDLPHAVDSVQHAESWQCAEAMAAEGSPPVIALLPVTRETGLPVSHPLPVRDKGVARGLQPVNADEYGSAEGVAKGRHVLGSNPTDHSAKHCQESAKALPVKWRPLATPPTTSTSSLRLPAPVIPEVEAAMRFRVWLLELGLAQIDRGPGELIAGVDLWPLAQRYAEGSGFRIDSRNRFFEALAKLPGVHKESDRWVTRLRGSREKRVAYSFRPAPVANRKAVGS